jgi:hypothetical protein
MASVARGKAWRLEQVPVWKGRKVHGPSSLGPINNQGGMGMMGGRRDSDAPTTAYPPPSPAMPSKPRIITKFRVSAAAVTYSQAARYQLPEGWVDGQAVLQQRGGGGGRVQPPGAAGRRHHRAGVHAPLRAAQEALRRRLPVLLTPQSALAPPRCAAAAAWPSSCGTGASGSNQQVSDQLQHVCRGASSSWGRGAEQDRHWFLTSSFDPPIISTQL